MGAKFIKLMLILACMTGIFCFSSDNGVQSSKKSDQIISYVVSAFHKDSSSFFQQRLFLKTCVVFVRKGAHFLIYLVLGTLLISFLSEFSISERNLLLLSIFFCFLYACSDELHQLFVPGRCGKMLDVFIDTIGASVGVVGYYILRYRHRKQIQ